MRVAVKPVITTSVALVGASVFAVSPVSAPTPTMRTVESDVSLTASSLAYVPINMIEQALSAPANMVAAMDRLAAALVISGDWNVNQPNNQWGWDEANPDMLMESINMLIPFPAFSEPWGRHVNWWATANLPMYEGCNFECPDLPGMLSRMFRVPMSEFYSEEGYTFPVVKTPFNGVETPWSEQNVKLDPAEPIKSVWDSLTGEPTGIKTTTLWEMVTAFANLSAALQVTGHMPDWVAVREIETFVKLFLRPPADDEETAPADTSSESSQLALVSTSAVAQHDTGVDLPQAPQLRSLRTAQVSDTPTDDTTNVAALTEESVTTDESATNESASPVADQVDDAATSIVDTATNLLKGKFAAVDDAAADDKDAAAPEKAGSDAADGKDSAEQADTDAASQGDKTAKDEADGGKHRKSDDTSGSDSSSGSGGGESSSGSGSHGSGGGDSSGGSGSSGT